MNKFSANSKFSNGVHAPLNNNCQPMQQDLNDEFDDDDDFTGAELEELEVIATQVETENIPEVSNNHERNGDGHMESDHPSLLQLQAKLMEMQEKIKQLDRMNKQKSGETILLRDKLTEAQQLLLSEREEKIRSEKMKKEENAKHHAELKKAKQQLGDLIEFKQSELNQAQSMIKNLQTNNKHLTEDTEMRCGATGLLPSNHASIDWSQRTDVTINHQPSRKIKFVKPESPKISANKSFKLGRDHPLASVTSPMKVEDSRRPKPRKKRVILKPSLLPSDSDSDHFRHLVEFLHRCQLHNSRMTTDEGERRIVDEAREAAFTFLHQPLVSSEKPAKRAAKIVCCVKMFCKRHLASNKSEEAQLACVASSLRVLSDTLERVPDLADDVIANEQDGDWLVEILCRLSRDEATANHALAAAAQFASNVSVVHLIRFTGFLRHLPRDDVTNLHLRLAILLTGHDDATRSLVTSSDDDDDDETFLEAVKRVCCRPEVVVTSSSRDLAASNRIRFLSTVVRFLSRLMSLHEELILRTSSLVHIQLTNNHILFHELTKWEDEDDELRDADRIRLVWKCTCLLHSCMNVLPEEGAAPDGNSPPPRDQKQFLVLWKLRRFVVVNDDDSLWCGEVKRWVERELEGLQ